MITSLGDVRVGRRYYACRHCRGAQIPWDRWAGLEGGHVTPQAYRMVVLAGASWSFDVARDRLWEFCGFRISDETIRRITEEAGERAGRWGRSSEAAVKGLREANGEAEFYTDGTSVNTREGWREMRLGIFAKRPAGRPAEPEEWAKRCLPGATGRWAFGGILSSEALGPQWGQMAERLGLAGGRGVSVLADGARWIWKQAAEHLPRSEWVVDVFHVSEHLHACGRVLYGEHTSAAREWADARLGMVLRWGPVALLRELEREGSEQSVEGARKAVEDLIGYVKPNLDGLWYRDRLRRGLPIGSGQVEGACKTVVGRRLKCNGARWTVTNADRMVGLCCLLYSDLWAAYWSSEAA